MTVRDSRYRSIESGKRHTVCGAGDQKARPKLRLLIPSDGFELRLAHYRGRLWRTKLSTHSRRDRNAISKYW